MSNLVPEPPVEQSESDFKYPVEVMDKIISWMNREEIAELEKTKELEESSVVYRIGSTKKSICINEPGNTLLLSVTGTDNINYWVIENQTVACKRIRSTSNYDNKCSRADPQQNTGYCSSERMTKIKLRVIPRDINYANLTKFDIILLIKEVDVMVNADCICDQIMSYLS